MSVLQSDSNTELELGYLLSEAEEDIKAGRTAPIQDTFDSIRSRLLQNNWQFEVKERIL